MAAPGLCGETGTGAGMSTPFRKIGTKVFRRPADIIIMNLFTSKRTLRGLLTMTAWKPLQRLAHSCRCAGLASIFFMWDYDQDNGTCYRDALECATTVTGPWSEVPGPYRLSENGKSYVVRIETTAQQYQFFRVARTWGTPLL